MCSTGNQAHGTPNGVRTVSLLASINIELLTEFRLRNSEYPTLVDKLKFVGQSSRRRPSVAVAWIV